MEIYADIIEWDTYERTHYFQSLEFSQYPFIYNIFLFHHMPLEKNKCSGCLLMCKKVPQNLMSSNNNLLKISHSSVSWLDSVGQFSLGISHGVAIEQQLDLESPEASLLIGLAWGRCGWNRCHAASPHGLFGLLYSMVLSGYFDFLLGSWLPLGVSDVMGKGRNF